MKHPDAEAMIAWAEYVEATGVPLSLDEANGVLDAWHALDAAGAGLHDQLAECVGRLGVDGRCTDCGRLVLVGAWRLQSHKDGGCMTAIPGVYTAMWLWRHKGAVPFMGQWLYRRRRRRLRARGADPSWNGSEPV